ncbi:U7 snRNA-associated Sm-like protein LSm11 [Hondaea fermentalgiana]|uniref:U7 snRNA-associated Sm-like protein LSm11 n=1 Tax=Hondaea fermentalgiana TaxID=2315210 RepID=A0A2R5GFM0_9STRA|nr:U7 snRNA-associated Sm-like protein LSm11 [Hondaea fermentalgiana]|eukprot:GBG29726.1 U7 snRNA-associated Sm-like protein LSm11 [Hondaea fermentalgiana]
MAETLVDQQGEGTKKQHAEDSDAARFDVRSEHFDAKLALQKPEKVKLPQKVFPLENLSRTRPLLPVSHPDHLQRRVVNPLLRAKESDAVARRRENEQRRLERKVKRKEVERFENPLHTLVDSFADGGPLEILRRCVQTKTRVRVIVGSAQDGVRGTCIGHLRGFDKFMNLFLNDAEESYATTAFVTVSEEAALSGTVQELTQFMQVYSPAKVGNAVAIAQKYNGRETDLWRFLYQKYGLTQRVQDALAQGKTAYAQGAASPEGLLPAGVRGKPLEGSLDARARELLRRHRGREAVLMCKLGVANAEERSIESSRSLFHANHDWTGAAVEAAPASSSEVDVCAEWVQRASLKYEGRVFYHNTRTKTSVWEPPEGVRFKTVEVPVVRRRKLRQTILRGDNVIMCSPVTPFAT